MEKEFKKDLDNIFILGRGQSLVRCPVKKPEKTEFWGCNNTYKARGLDRLFIMRDIYITQFNREKNLLKDINEKDFPVYTLGAYKKIKNNVVYPVEEVIKEFKLAYLLNNAAYMLALAIMQKPKNIMLFGVDMYWGTQGEYMRNEKACVEYWLGVIVGRGIRFKISEGSTLMKRNKRSNFYGMEVKKDKSAHVVALDPVYLWGRTKCALKYKLMTISHNA